MPANIRYLTRRADGRESVRAAVAPGPAFTIGRASGCDVRLPDLLVSLAHARLEMSGPATVQIQALGSGARLTVNRRLVRQASADLSQGPAEIQIGPFDLTVCLDPAGALQIDVVRARGETQAMTARAVKGIFSLRGTWLSKRAAAWGLAIGVMAAGLAFPLALLAPERPRQDSPQRSIAEHLWLAGKTSNAHAGIVEGCAACHAAPFVSVEDKTCLACHTTTLHHADPARMARADPGKGPFRTLLVATADTFGKPEARCTSCHTEHNGPAGAVPVQDAQCADCHAAMSVRLPDAKLGDAGDFAARHPQFRPALADVGAGDTPVRRWSVDELETARRAAQARQTAKPQACDGFEIGQANFRGELPGLAGPGTPGDRSGLVFPHAVHVDPNGCVAAIARQLGPAAGYGDKGLGCADCHEPDEARALFRPITMERHCAACHSLTFDTVAGVPRTLKHGSPEDVVATLRDFYQARVVNRVLQISGPPVERARPGPAGAWAPPPGQAVFRLADREASRRIHDVFKPRGACFGCHVVTPPANGGFGYKVAPVNLRDSFLPAARFPHSAHEAGLKCADCHSAESSARAADVLIPGIETCRNCHGGERAFGKVESSCVSCHGYHALAGQPVMTPAVRAAHARQRPATAVPVLTAPPSPRASP